MTRWRDGNLSDFAEVGPKVATLGEDAPFIAMADVGEWGRWASPSGPRGNRSGICARGGDVLVARITPCLENGKIAQVPKELGDVGGSTEFIVLRAKPEVALNDFVLLWQDRPTQQAAVSLMVGTSGRQRVAASDLAALPFAEQRRIVEVMSAVDVQTEALEVESASVKRP